MKSTTVKAVLLAPWVITLAVFWIYPLIYALVLSFTEYQTLTNSMTFVGFDNYKAVFTSDSFWQAFRNTAIFTGGTVPVTTTAALLLATAVRSQTAKYATILRSSYFLPSVTSLVVIALIFTNLYSRDGYISALVSMIGFPVPEHGWLLSTQTALPAIMFMDVWISIGYYMILFLSAMETIPRDLYETASLEGATPWQQFVRITLPLVKPTLLFVVVINTIKSFQIFVEVYVMTKGGPLGATTTLVYNVYNSAFEQTNLMGYASAVAWVVFVLLAGISALQLRLLRVRD